MHEQTNEQIHTSDPKFKSGLDIIYAESMQARRTATSRRLQGNAFRAVVDLDGEHTQHMVQHDWSIYGCELVDDRGGDDAYVYGGCACVLGL